MNIVDKMIDYENGKMTEEEMVKFFQLLIDTGMAWQLQGHYQRAAHIFINSGYCTVNIDQKVLH